MLINAHRARVRWSDNLLSILSEYFEQMKFAIADVQEHGNRGTISVGTGTFDRATANYLGRDTFIRSQFETKTG